MIEKYQNLILTVIQSKINQLENIQYHFLVEPIVPNQYILKRILNQEDIRYYYQWHHQSV